MSKVQELMNLVQKQNQGDVAKNETTQVVNNNPKAVHSNYNDLAPKGPNKTPKNVGWMPGMMYVPHGGGSNTGF